ncbi:MAG: TonB-dependent receptor [Pseudoxanthomonas sp.]
MNCKIKHTPRIRPSLLAIPLAALATQVSAEEKATELQTIVVTATATEKDLKDAPASISVVTREELDLRPVLDLSDAVRGTPGVNIAGIGLTRRGIRIRGMDPEYTLVLLDGRRVNAASDAIAHADFDLGWVPASAIERVEIVRGPMSSLYGSEALGGVVNVITRSATDDWRGNLVYNGGVVAGGRGGGATQAGVYAGGALVPGKLGLSFFGEHRRKDATVDPADPRLHEQDGREADTGNVVLTWTPDAAQRIDLSHLQGHEQRWRNTLQSGTPSYVYENVDDVDRAQTTLSHRGDWSWGQSYVSAYHSTLDRRNRRSQGTPTRPQSLTDDIVDGRVTIDLGRSHKFSAGGEWRREQLDDTSAALSGHVEADQTALFVQDEIQFTPAWSLVLGDRGDHHPEYGWHHSPRAYSVWHATDALTLKGGVGSGFKAPSLKQLSPEYSAVGGGGRFTIYGNPDLKPETTTSYELAASYDRGDWNVQATVFQNDLEDLIQTICVASCGIRGREVRNYTNVAEARIRGLELSGSLQLPAGFALDGNYTRLQTRDLETGLALNERPRHSGAANLRWSGERLQASLRGEYVGSQSQLSGTAQVSLPAYSLLSLDARYRITPKIAVTAGVDNLADKRLDETSALYPYPETGRYFHAGIDLGF